MDLLSVTTLELWPRKSKAILKEKQISIPKLKCTFSHIIFPWDDNYDQQRMLFSTQIQERPLFIIRACSKSDIIATLNLLPKYNLTLRIVGGRHSTLLQNPDIFLDMSAFTKIKLSKDKKSLIVGSGLSQGQVSEFLFQHSKSYHVPCGHPNRPNSLIFPAGSASTVGVAGISTIGGIGTLRRTFGLTVDSILSFEIVIPPTESRGAKVVTASATHRSDLFWANLGGNAANFGVVTKIKYKVIKSGKVILYEVSWPWEQAAAVLDQWQVTAPTRPSAFNEDLAIFNGINNDLSRLGIHLSGVYVIPLGQTPMEAEQEIKQQLSPLGGKLIMDPPAKYASVYTLFVSGRVYHNFSTGKTILTTKSTPGSLLVERMEKSKLAGGYCYLGLQLMGGKIADVPASATAYFPRAANFFIDIFNFWESAVNQGTNIKWNNQSFKQIYPIAGPYVYLGFPINHLPDHLNAYYGENKDRLLAIKSQIDPLNVLKFPGSL